MCVGAVSGSELEVKTVVGLEDESTWVCGEVSVALVVGPVAALETEGSVVGVDRDGALRDPRERFGETGVDAVEEDPSKAECVRNRSVPVESRSDSVVEIAFNSRVYIEPAALETLSVANCPAESDSKRPTRSTVVCSVNRFFRLLPLGISSVTSKGGKANAPDILCILEVDIDISPKCVFQVFVVSFPGDYLRVCSLQIRLKHYISRICNKQLTDVR